MEQHNLGLSRYTAKFKPWDLVYLEAYQSKSHALIRERSLKKYAKSQIIELINGNHTNMIHPTDFPNFL